ncbi:MULTISPECIES: hypothetical protein [Listeria]|uniref:hypothetical protein n=1 Tax=Listeria TaxID=1637 RepID=UPI000B58C912|nr:MULTISPECIES: hypothetical protein [Listeria]
MATFTLLDKVIFENASNMELKDENGKIVALIKKEVHSDREKDNSYIYTAPDGTMIGQIHRKNTGIKRFILAEYEFYYEGKRFELKDKVGNSMLYFSVIAEFLDQKILIEENLNEDVDLHANDKLLATILTGDSFFTISFSFDDNVDTHSHLFVLLVLMYFMLKIYKDETGVVDDIIDIFED